MKQIRTVVVLITVLAFCGCAAQNSVDSSENDSAQTFVTEPSEKLNDYNFSAGSDEDLQPIIEDIAYDLLQSSPEPIADDTYDLLEEWFYGEWQCVTNEDSITISDAYGYPPFTGSPSVTETDDMAAIHLVGNGGNYVYVIFKSNPNTMFYYEEDIYKVPKLNGEYQKIGNAPETGELGAFGLHKLSYLYGVPTDLLFGNSFADENGGIWINDSVYLQQLTENSISLIALCYEETPALSSYPHYEVTYSVIKSSGEWSIDEESISFSDLI